MGHGLSEAYWFLPFVIPIGLYVAYSDLSRMKIPNHSVYALVAVFAIIGVIALPFDIWLWRWPNLVVVLVLGILGNALRLLGAGDAKFMAAAAPFVATSDLSLMLYIMAACFAGSYIVHRLAKHSPARRLAPSWESWTSGKRFPMGFPLAASLIVYLAVPLF